MASFIYIYSKFTEEFLLLSAAGIFFFMALYCYHWVVKKRRLGAARDQVPAGMVKVYLNQLIQEAQFVRTQLFGLLGGEAGAAEALARFQSGSQFQAPIQNTAPSPSFSSEAGPIPTDLLERLKALETQLADKESMVVNINVEKTKLLEEVENLKQNSQISQSAADGTQDLTAKVKALEERLEEYALFEDDLANLKRLQQENAALKKRLETASEAAPAPAPTPAKETAPPTLSLAEEVKPEPKTAPKVEATPPVAEAADALDQAAIDALLNGSTPIAPEEVQTAVAPTATTGNDDFEKLIDSVETSLTPATAAEPAVAAAPAAAPPAPAQSAADPNASKTDEELLKEFENLLNS